MASYAKVVLVGNVGRDPETRYTPSGAMNVNFSVATNRRFRDSSGQDQERTTWFRVTAWGRLAETLDALTQRGALTRGKQVLVDGRIELREYNDPQTNERRSSLDVTANDVQLLGTRGDSEQGGDDYGVRESGARGGGGGDRRQFDEGGDSFNDVPF
ncbi:MAG: single-stranded DNA-binding protein [Chloroflexota bacterium]|nr:single-stranded DNA-binding protein [Chloroflexota bacterium]